MGKAITRASRHCHEILIEAYIEALLVDAELADLVWEAWNIGIITDDLAALAWSTLAATGGD